MWQIPSTLYKVLPVSYAELVEKVYDKGPLGKYLVEQLIAWNNGALAANIRGIRSMELSIARWETHLRLA